MSDADLTRYIQQQTKGFAEYYGIQSGKAFMLVYAIEALRLDQDSAYEAVSYDGGNDKSIDLFLVDEQFERVVIAQGKYNAKGEYKPKVGEFLELVHSTDWLANPEALRREGREDLAAAAEDYNAAIAKGYSVEFHFVYMGPPKKEVLDAAANFNAAAAGGSPSKTARVVGLDLIGHSHDEYIDKSTRIATDTIRIPVSQTFEQTGAFGRARVASFPGSELKRLYQTYGDRLFDRNVRLYLGARKGSVNAGIRETLESSAERENFWAYNNGMTIVCDRYDFHPETGELTLINFSIVNGCQTTVSVAAAPDEAAADVMVLGRIISSSQEPVVDSIITFTNRQTPIQLWDISSQDKLQKRIKKELAEEPHPYFYLIRSGEKPKTSDKKYFTRNGKLQAISYAPLAQYLAAFQGMPVMAYKDKSKLLLSERSTIFPDDIRVEKLMLVWQAAEAAEAAVREAISEAVSKGADNEVRILRQGGKLFVLAILGIILDKRNGNTFVTRLKRDVAGSKATSERLKPYAKLSVLWYVQAVKAFVDAGAVLTQLVRSQEFYPKLRDRITENWKVQSMSKAWVDDALPKL
jgi:hypothetical protein